MNEPALDQAVVAAEYELTLRAHETARKKLAEALGRVSAELSRYRDAAAAHKARADIIEAEVRRQFEDERVRLLAEVERAMKNAEDIRREGVEALEQARQLKK